LLHAVNASSANLEATLFIELLARGAAPGCTPVVRLQRSVGDAAATVVGKLESLNPNSSVKDRRVTRHALKHHYVLTVMGTESARFCPPLIL